jgi:anti-sigma regulatory factor (Ser/Thr protein kinase)
MEDLSLHILDIAENSVTAGATKIEIRITEDIRGNLLIIEIEDNGKGMEEEMLKHACDPFYTTRKIREVGLGIPLLAQATRESNGTIEINSTKGKGTRISASFRYNDIDRKPMGDMGKTMSVLILSRPDMDIYYEHRINDETYTFDTSEIKKELDGIPINSPEVISIIKDSISTWLRLKQI